MITAAISAWCVNSIQGESMRTRHPFLQAVAEEDGKGIQGQGGCREEDHKIIDTKDPKALSNMAKWIHSH